MYRLAVFRGPGAQAWLSCALCPESEKAAVESIHWAVCSMGGLTGEDSPPNSFMWLNDRGRTPSPGWRPGLPLGPVGHHQLPAGARRPLPCGALRRRHSG